MKIVDNIYKKLEKSTENVNVESAVGSFVQYLKKTANASIWFVVISLAFMVITIAVLNMGMPGIVIKHVDFGNYREAAGLFARGEFDLIYSEAYFNAQGFGPFRYFPMMLVFFVPFVLMPFEIAYILFTIINIVLVLYTHYLIVKIIVKLKLPAKTGFVQTTSLFFIFFVFEFLVQGQIVGILIVILLNAMIKLIDGKDFQAALLIGICTIFKPVTIILMSVLLISATRFKTVIKYVVGILIPMVPDILFFTYNPIVFTRFIMINVSSLVKDKLEAPRCDMVDWLASLTGIPRFYFFLIILVICVVLATRIIPKINDRVWKTVFTFGFSFAFYQASQPDMWGSQMLLIYPFVILAGTMITQQNELFKYRSWFLGYQVLIYSCAGVFYIALSISTEIHFIAILLSILAMISTAGFIWSWLKPTIIFTMQPKNIII